MQNISSQGEKLDEDRPTFSLDTFPYRELKKIDQLWLKYLEGRLGFSVQQKFYFKQVISRDTFTGQNIELFKKLAKGKLNIQVGLLA